jgi:hypothetical protein
MKKVKNGALVTCLAYSSIMKMEEICFSETSAEFSRNIRRYISEEEILHSLFCSPFMTILTSDMKRPVDSYETTASGCLCELMNEFVCGQKHFLFLRTVVETAMNSGKLRNSLYGVTLYSFR